MARYRGAMANVLAEADDGDDRGTLLIEGLARGRAEDRPGGVYGVYEETGAEEVEEGIDWDRGRGCLPSGVYAISTERPRRKVRDSNRYERREREGGTPHIKVWSNIDELRVSRLHR